MAELVYAHGSGPCSACGVGVQVSSGAPKRNDNFRQESCRFFLVLLSKLVKFRKCSFAPQNEFYKTSQWFGFFQRYKFLMEFAIYLAVRYILMDAIYPFGVRVSLRDELKEFISYRNETKWSYIEFALANILHERERVYR